MVVICPECRKEHHIDENRIPPNVKVAKCRACGARFPLPVSTPSPDTVAVPGVGVKKTRAIGVALSKGGVGKTTTSVNLATGLAHAGYDVLLVDTDTQGQDAYMLGAKPNAGLTELVTRELSPQEALCQVRERLWLLAGGKSLAGIKRLISRKDFGGEMTLSEALKPIESAYDFVIVDTSPGWDPLTVNALFYVTEILTPVSLEVMTLHGLLEFLKSLASIQKYHNTLTLKYILPTFLDLRIKQSAKILEKLDKLYGQLLCKPIRYNVRLSEAPAFGQSIFEFAPGSHGADDYRDLVRKVAGREDLFEN